MNSAKLVACLGENPQVLTYPKRRWSSARQASSTTLPVRISSPKQEGHKLPVGKCKDAAGVARQNGRCVVVAQATAGNRQGHEGALRQ